MKRIRLNTRSMSRGTSTSGTPGIKIRRIARKKVKLTQNEAVANTVYVEETPVQVHTTRRVITQPAPQVEEVVEIQQEPQDPDVDPEPAAPARPVAATPRPGGRTGQPASAPTRPVRAGVAAKATPMTAERDNGGRGPVVLRRAESGPATPVRPTKPKRIQITKPKLNWN